MTQIWLAISQHGYKFTNANPTKIERSNLWPFMGAICRYRCKINHWTSKAGTQISWIKKLFSKAQIRRRHLSLELRARLNNSGYVQSTICQPNTKCLFHWLLKPRFKALLIRFWIYVIGKECAFSFKYRDSDFSKETPWNSIVRKHKHFGYDSSFLLLLEIYL